MTARAMVRVLCVLGFAALALACTTAHGRFDFDANASFASYRNYAFIHPGPPEEGTPEEGVPTPSADLVASQLNERRVQAAIERELRAKGLEPAPEETADLLVAFNISSREASRPEFYPSGMAYGWPYGWWYDHWDTVYTRIYTEGLVIVDLIEAKSRQLVWRGWTADPLPSSGYARVVDHAIGQVMRNYPPPPR
jgi:Domain of unknown function (DUF4136)